MTSEFGRYCILTACGATKRKRRHGRPQSARSSRVSQHETDRTNHNTTPENGSRNRTSRCGRGT